MTDQIIYLLWEIGRMKLKHHNIDQNTPEWMALRVGRFTSSTFKDLFLKETTQTYINAIYKVAYERFTKEAVEGYENEWMIRGRELEPEARLVYELSNEVEVANGGFYCDEWVGSSPDGLIGDDGLLEIKCPKYSTHIQYIIDKKLPTIYKWQVQGQLYCSDRDWCDFFSYHPGLPPFKIRVKRDDKLILQLQEKLSESIDKANSIIKTLEERNG